MVKNDVFDIYMPELFGMHSVSVLSDKDAGNSNNALKMSISPMCRVGNVYVHRV